MTKKLRPDQKWTAARSRAWKRVKRTVWATVRRQVFERDGYRCRKCGRAGRLECDHIIPVANGGDLYDLDNLQALCRSCHIAKTRGESIDRLPPERRKWRKAVDELLFG